MESICGVDCSICDLFKKHQCKGCKSSNGCPFGKKCFIASYIEIGGKESFLELKKILIEEFNSLQVEGMSKIEELYPLNGSFINLEYSLPNGNKVKFLQDDEIYLGNQIQCDFCDDEVSKCFGVVADTRFLLVCEYEEDGKNPEVLLYKRR